MVSPSAKRSEVIMMYKVLLPDCKHFLLSLFYVACSFWGFYGGIWETLLEKGHMHQAKQRN